MYRYCSISLGNVWFYKCPIYKLLSVQVCKTERKVYLIYYFSFILVIFFSPRATYKEYISLVERTANTTYCTGCPSFGPGSIHLAPVPTILSPGWPGIGGMTEDYAPK